MKGVMGVKDSNRFTESSFAITTSLPSLPSFPSLPCFDE